MKHYCIAARIPFSHSWITWLLFKEFVVRSTVRKTTGAQYLRLVRFALGSDVGSDVGTRKFVVVNIFGHALSESVRKVCSVDRKF